MNTPNRQPRVTVTLPPELHEQVLKAAEAADLPIVFWARQAFRLKLKADQEAS